MKPITQKLASLKTRAMDRYLAFQPVIREMPVSGAPVRFLIATPQASDWYDPLKPHNRRELEWLVEHVAPRGEVIIDAGAFHGLYAAVLGKAAGPGGRVVAIDPVASNCAVIEANLALNGIDAKVVTCAVSNQPGEVRFSRETCGHVVPSGGVAVPACRLAEVAPDAAIVKLDIEGQEFTVVPAQIDECARARAWIVEIHPGREGDPKDVTGAFRSRGFDLWWSRPEDGEIVPYDDAPWTHRGTLVAMRPRA